MPSVSPILDSSIGRKFLMALSGIFLLLFVVAHLLGNLQIFAGQKAFNDYAAFLQSIPGPLWAARIAILAIFLLHVVMAFRLRRLNSQARPTPYQYRNTVQASAASLFMLESGLVILLFVIVHLLHFTFGRLQPEYAHLLDALGRHDVYSMVIHGFQNKLYSGLYIGCMLLLGIHLSHGFASLFQTFGVQHKGLSAFVRGLSPLLAALISLGYIAIPVSVLLGIVTLPGGF